MNRSNLNNGKLPQDEHYSSSNSLNYVSDSSYRSSNQSLNKDADVNNNNRSNSQLNLSQPSINTKLLYGDITLEMIDDFLNPINKKKSKDLRPEITFVSPTATNGMGIIDYGLGRHSSVQSLSARSNLTSSEHGSLIDENYLPFRSRENPDDEFAYVNHIRKEFLKELKESGQETSSVNTLCH